MDYSITEALSIITQPSKTVENATDYGATYVKVRPCHIMSPPVHLPTIVILFSPTSLPTPIPTPPPPRQACTTFLSGSKCPAALRVVAGYGAKGGFSDFRGDCGCAMVDASDSVRDTLTGFLLKKKLATTAATLPVAEEEEGSNPDPAPGLLDVCTTFDAACGTFLEDIACPTALRNNHGCLTPNAPETLAGTCRCGALDASGSVKAALLGLALPDTALEAAKAQTAASSSPAAVASGVEPTVDFCQTYANTCTAFLTKVREGMCVRWVECVM